jgi:hypothetical protein
MLIIYAMAAVVSFLVAWIIKLTFTAIRMHSTRGAGPAETPAKAQTVPARAGPDGGA